MSDPQTTSDEQIIRDFLTNKDWGKYPYMEGSEIYADRDKALAALNRMVADINSMENAMMAMSDSLGVMANE